MMKALGPRSLFAFVLALLPLAARADWLVTRQGARIETRGTWSEKGRLVVFTTADGKLASVRLEEVDLAASIAATSAAAQAVGEPEPDSGAMKQAVVVLTDADFEHVTPGPPPNADPVAAKKEAAAAPGSGLAVATWEQKRAGAGIEIVGSLANGSASTATGIRLTVIAFDEDGKQAARGVATVSTNALPAGQSARFHIVFPELRQLVSVRFDPKATLFDANAGSEDPAPTAAPAGEAPPG